MPNIKLEKVTKRWGNFYGVDNLTLDIENNAFVTLLGPSGCGKTTILRMIAGLETPTSGKISIGDTVVFDSEKGINVPPNKRKVGFIFQNYALWPNMTVYKNISFGLTNIKGMSKEEIDSRVMRVAKLVKIEKFLDRYPAELSGGQQQRVAIARTLAPDPEVLFMDEPLSNLDAKLRLDMRYELKRLHVDTGRTFVYVTHDQMEAMTLATKVCLMNNAVCEQYAEPLTVYKHPVDTFAADFVGNPSINFVNAKVTSENNDEFKCEILNDIKVKFVQAGEKVNMDNWYKELDATLRQNENELNEAKTKKGYVEKSNKIELFRYNVETIKGSKCGNEDAQNATKNELTIGIRPEFISIYRESEIDKNKKYIDAEVYASMPTGMESTVKLRIGDFLLTSVIFGAKDYSVGEKVKVDFSGHHILLFDKKSGKTICVGELLVE